MPYVTLTLHSERVRIQLFCGHESRFALLDRVRIHLFHKFVVESPAVAFDVMKPIQACAPVRSSTHDSINYSYSECSANSSTIDPEVVGICVRLRIHRAEGDQPIDCAAKGAGCKRRALNLAKRYIQLRKAGLHEIIAQLRLARPLLALGDAPWLKITLDREKMVLVLWHIRNIIWSQRERQIHLPEPIS